MFHNYFINTRSSIDHIHKQLQILSRVVSFSTQALFIGYYVYLVIINLTKTGFLVMYASLLALSLVTLVFDILFVAKEGNTRLEKRLSIERRRKLSNLFLFVRILLKITVIVLSGVELVQYQSSKMQMITFTLSIVLLVFYLVINALIFIVNKDIDLIRLSVESDVANSKLLTKLLKQDKVKKEYTEQEQQLLEEIEDRAKVYLNDSKKD